MQGREQNGLSGAEEIFDLKQQSCRAHRPAGTEGPI